MPKSDFLNSNDLNEQFHFAVKKMGLNYHQCHPIQRDQIRKFWYAGAGQMLLLIQQELIHSGTEKETLIRIDNLLSQVYEFWEKLGKNHKP